MNRLLMFVVFGVFTVSISSAQEDFEDQIDRTSDDIERFVEGLVDNIEHHIERIVEEREYDDQSVEVESDQDREKLSTSPDAITFNGDTEIPKDDTVQGDLVVKNGTLTLYGTVVGDVLVVNGDIELKNSARVLGNVRAMNGSIAKSEGAFIEGYTEQSSKSVGKKYKRKNTYRARYSYSFKPYFWNVENGFDDNFLFRYNRVEGFFFGLGSEKKFYWDGSKIVAGYGSFGYGFASHKWRLQLGLDRQFAFSDEHLVEVGGEAHSFTDTKDEWIMNLGENNITSLLFREDYRDYFQREGFSIHTAHYTKSGDAMSMFDVRYLQDRYATMFNSASWAVFGGRTFRGNPVVNAGLMKSVSVSAGFSTVEKYRYHSEGWNLLAKAEYGGNELGGDFNFTQGIVDIRRFQPISDDDQMSIRLRAGALEGAPIFQKMFELGGANTLPAYGFKEFSGNRMVLANVEYKTSGDWLDDVFFWPNSLAIIGFGDVGAVTMVNTKWSLHEGFSSITSSQVRSDYGVALSWFDGDARLGFAWRTDKQSPVSIFLRLHRAF